MYGLEFTGDMLLTPVPASFEKSSLEKGPGDLRALLTSELHNAILALEAKQPDVLIGKHSLRFYRSDPKSIMVQQNAPKSSFGKPSWIW